MLHKNGHEPIPSIHGEDAVLSILDKRALTDSNRIWVAVPPADPKKGGVFDIRSGASGNGKDGTPYKNW